MVGDHSYAASNLSSLVYFDICRARQIWSIHRLFGASDEFQVFRSHWKQDLAS